MNALLFPAIFGVAGWWAMPRLAPALHPAGRLGLGLLMGIGAGTTLLMVAGLAGLPLTRLTLIAVGVLLLAGGFALRRSDPPTPAGARWTPAAGLLLLLLGLVFLSAAWRAGFYPVSAMDAHSYDGRARWIVAEKTLQLSIYREPGLGAGGNLTYPPLQPLGLALGYWSGATEGKLIDAAWFGALLLTLYGVTRPRLGRAGALLAALLVAAAPELWRHASLALTNLPAAAYAGAALLLLATGQAELPAGLLLAFATGVRPDGAVMAVAIALATWRGWRRAVIVAGPAILLLGAWQIALASWLGASSASAFRGSLLPDPALLAAVLRAFGALAVNPGLYGWCFAIFLAGLVAGRDRESLVLTRATLLMAAALVVLFQQIDPAFGGGGGSYLQNSLKRDLFYLLPGAVTAGLGSPPLRALVGRLDG